MSAFELGLYTFAELLSDASGSQISPAERLRDVVDEARCC